MLNYVGGDLFESPAQTLVNTVNTVGVMGKGVAKRFKEIFPDMFEEYQALCENRDLKVGTLHFYKGGHKNVLNFPTKKHWRNPSKVEWIESGLKAFLRMYESAGISSIAFPPLGCGNGGLDFESEVKPLMEEYLQEVSIPVFIHLYDKVDPIPEHNNPKETERWLRSQPSDLSFWEVWEDLNDVLDRKERFTTLVKSNPFTALISAGSSNVTEIEQISESEEGIQVRSSSREYFIDLEGIQAFWQQLRSAGVISGRNAPSRLEKKWSYLAPIFAELDYVERIKMSGEYASLVNHPRLGLRYRRPVTSSGTSENAIAGQLSMFSDDVEAMR